VEAASFKTLRESPPPITSLYICNRALSGTCHWTIVGKLLDALPSLQHLALGGNTPSPLHAQFIPRFRLASFFWDNGVANDDQVLHHLLRNSVGTLRTLSFRFEPKPSLLAYLLHTFRDTLRKLANCRGMP